MSVVLAFRHNLGEAFLRHFQRAVDVAIKDAHLEHLQPRTVRVVEEPREDRRPGRVTDR